MRYEIKDKKYLLIGFFSHVKLFRWKEKNDEGV